MAMRELVTGGAACAVPGSSSSSNPLGALANALIGSSSQKERLQEIPTSTVNTSGNNLYSGGGEPISALPGSEFEHSLQHENSGFVNGFHAANDNRLSKVWDRIQNPQVPHFHGQTNFPQGHHQLQPELNGPPQRVLSSFLHSFVNSSHGGVPFDPTQLPVLGLSEGDKRCILDRSSIMARHIFADKPEDFINDQVNALLSSLEIDNHAMARGHMPGRHAELEQYWGESQVMTSRPSAADGWADEFAQNRVGQNNPNAWALSFERQHGSGGWASEFQHEQAQMTMVDRGIGANIPSLTAIKQTRMLAHTLAQNSNPKFQNSKFLQFVSKMSRGELTIEDYQVKTGSGDWANEYQLQYNAGPSSWADQYAHEQQVSRGPDRWAEDFASERAHHDPVDEQWVNEFPSWM